MIHDNSNGDRRAYIVQKFGLDTRKSPVEIPNIGRDGFAALLNDMGCVRGVEIGVEQGLYSDVLCRAIPGLDLYCVDPYKAYGGYRDHVSQPKLDRFFEVAQARLATYHVTFIRNFSMAAVHDFDDASMDFVYIDGNHSIQHCINDIAEWSKKVKPGGIIAGHDYARYRLPNQIQVVQAVNAWTDANEIAPWFLLGRQAKVEGEIRDNARSWFWVHDPPPPLRKQRIIKQ